MKSFLQNNDVKMYSIHNEGKSVIAERFIRTSKSKIYKYMTSVSKNVYIDKLDAIVYKCNNTYGSTIKMKATDIKSNTCIESSRKINDKNFKIGDTGRTLKYKNVFAKGYTPNWSGEVFAIKKVKNTVPWTYIISDLNGEEIVGMLYINKLQKTDQKEFRIKKLIKRKKVINYMLYGKDAIIRSIVVSIKKT